MKTSLPSLLETKSGPSAHFRDLIEMQRRMDRFLDRVLNNGDLEPNLGSIESAAFVPACNIEETEECFVLNLDVPGVKKEDLKIDLHGHVLTVSGERRTDFETSTKSQHRSESSFGTFLRSFDLASEIDPEKIEAQYQDGVLRIAIPKTEDLKTKSVKIHDPDEGGFEKLLGQKKENSKTQH